MQVFVFFSNCFQKLLNYFGIKDYLIFLRISVCLLFGLLPFRLLGIFRFDFYPRALIGLAFVLFTFYFSRHIIPVLLSNKAFQICFYYGLILDEHFKSMRPIFRVLIFFIIVFTIIALLLFEPKAYFFSTVCILSWSFYKSLKANFVNLKSPFCFVSVRKDPSKRDYFTWFDVVQNITLVCFFLFDRALIYNKLDKDKYNMKFRYLTRTIFPVYSVNENSPKP
jgi:hypothetical protein